MAEILESEFRSHDASSVDHFESTIGITSVTRRQGKDSHTVIDRLSEDLLSKAVLVDELDDQIVHVDKASQKKTERSAVVMIVEEKNDDEGGILGEKDDVEGEEEEEVDEERGYC
jgi:hypothetical protein